MQFPKFLHHPEHGAKRVENADEEKALGNGWYAHPRDFPKEDLSDVVIDAAKSTGVLISDKPKKSDKPKE